MLGKMHFNGQGGATNVVEARRLLKLAAAQDHVGVRQALDVVNKAAEERRAREVSSQHSAVGLGDK